MKVKEIYFNLTVFLWLKLYIILLILKGMKKFIQENPEIIFILTWFALIITITICVI